MANCNAGGVVYIGRMVRRDRLAVGVALAACAAAAPAQELKIERVDCRAGVHVVARDVPMSRVLQELSQLLGFHLKFQADTDRKVTLDLTRPPAQLVAKLLESDSVVYDEIPDPRCPGRQTLARVWVLPRGEDGPPPPRELTPMEQYRRAHGLPLEDPADQDKPAQDGAPK